MDLPTVMSWDSQKEKRMGLLWDQHLESCLVKSWEIHWGSNWDWKKVKQMGLRMENQMDYLKEIRWGWHLVLQRDSQRGCWTGQN